MEPQTVAQAWWQVAEHQLSAARTLLLTNYPRASLSRAYYAVYSACCACFEGQFEKECITNADGKEAWWFPHRSIEGLLDTLLGPSATFGEEWTELKVFQFVQLVKRLQSLRVEADYDPVRQHQVQDADNACRDARAILDALKPRAECRP